MADIPLFTGSAGSLPQIAPENSIDRIDPTMYGKGGQAAQYIPSAATAIARGVKGAVDTYQEEASNAADISLKQTEVALAPYKVEAAQYNAITARTRAETEAKTLPLRAQAELQTATNQAKLTDYQAKEANFKSKLVEAQVDRQTTALDALGKIQGGDIAGGVDAVHQNLPAILGLAFGDQKDLAAGIQSMISNLPRQVQGADPETQKKAGEILQALQQQSQNAARQERHLPFSVPSVGSAPSSYGANGTPAADNAQQQRPGGMQLAPQGGQAQEDLPYVSAPGKPPPEAGGSLAIRRQALAQQYAQENPEQAQLAQVGDLEASKAKNTWVDEQLKNTKPDDAQIKTVNSNTSAARVLSVYVDQANQIEAQMAAWSAANGGRPFPVGPGTTTTQYKLAAESHLPGAGDADTPGSAANYKAIVGRMGQLSTDIISFYREAQQPDKDGTGVAIRNLTEFNALREAILGQDIGPEGIKDSFNRIRGLSNAANSIAQVANGLSGTAYVGDLDAKLNGYALQVKPTILKDGRIIPNPDIPPPGQYIGSILNPNAQTPPRNAQTGRALAAPPGEGASGVSHLPDHEQDPEAFKTEFKKTVSQINHLDIPESMASANDALMLRTANTESGGDPKAKNKESTASGLFQLTDGPGQKLWRKRFGSEEYDPEDPVRAKVVATDLMNEQLNAFGGNTRIAVAGYKLGEPTLRNYYDTAKQSLGHAPSWNELLPYIPREIKSGDKTISGRKDIADYVAKTMGDNESKALAKLPPGTTTQDVLKAALPTQEHVDIAQKALAPQSVADLHRTALAKHVDDLKGTLFYDFAKAILSENPLAPVAEAQAETPDGEPEQLSPIDQEDGFFDHRPPKSARDTAAATERAKHRFDDPVFSREGQSVLGAGINAVGRSLQGSSEPRATQPAGSELNPFRGPDDAGAETPEGAAPKKETQQFGISRYLPQGVKDLVGDLHNHLPTWMQAMSVGASKTALASFDDEAAGNLRHIIYGEPVNVGIDKARALRDQLAQDNPGFYKTGEYVVGPLAMAGGSAALGALKGAGAAKTAITAGEEVAAEASGAAGKGFFARAGQIVEGAKQGAVVGAEYGAVNAAGDAEGSVSQRAEAVPGGALGGAATGAAIGTTIGVIAAGLSTGPVKSALNKIQELTSGTKLPEGKLDERGWRQAYRMFKNMSTKDIERVKNYLDESDHPFAAVIDKFPNFRNADDFIKSVATSPEASDFVTKYVNESQSGRNVRVADWLKENFPTSAEKESAANPDTSGTKILPTAEESLKGSLSEQAASKEDSLRETLSPYSSKGELPENPEEGFSKMAETFQAKEIEFEKARSDAAQPHYDKAKEELPDLRTLVPNAGVTKFAKTSVDPWSPYNRMEGSPPVEEIRQTMETVRNAHERIPGYQSKAVERAMANHETASVLAKFGDRTQPPNSYDNIDRALQELGARASDKNVHGQSTPDARVATIARRELADATAAESDSLRTAREKYAEGSTVIKGYDTKAVQGFRKFTDKTQGLNVNELPKKVLDMSRTDLENLLGNFSDAEKKVIQDGVLSHLQTEAAAGRLPSTKLQKDNISLVFGKKNGESVISDLGEHRAQTDFAEKLSSEKKPLGEKFLSMEPSELRSTFDRLSPAEQDSARGAVRDELARKYEAQGKINAGDVKSGIDFTKGKDPERLKIVFGEEGSAKIIARTEEERQVSQNAKNIAVIGSPTRAIEKQDEHLETMQKTLDSLSSAVVKREFSIPRILGNIFSMMKKGTLDPKDVQGISEVLLDKTKGRKFIDAVLERRAREEGFAKNIEPLTKLIDLIAKNPAKAAEIAAAQAGTGDNKSMQSTVKSETYQKTRQEAAAQD